LIATQASFLLLLGIPVAQFFTSIAAEAELTQANAVFLIESIPIHTWLMLIPDTKIVLTLKFCINNLIELTSILEQLLNAKIFAGSFQNYKFHAHPFTVQTCAFPSCLEKRKSCFKMN
jgi:hypothetical protein